MLLLVGGGCLCESFIKGSLGVYTSVLRHFESIEINIPCKEQGTASNRHCKEQPLKTWCKEQSVQRGDIAQSLQGTVTARNSHCKGEPLKTWCKEQSVQRGGTAQSAQGTVTARNSHCKEEPVYPLIAEFRWFPAWRLNREHGLNVPSIL